MTETQQTRRPQAPQPAERAKTIALRNGPAILMPALDRRAADDERVVPVLQHVHASGSVSVLLPDDHPIVTSARAADSGELAMMIELADQAPVDLREPIRGLLWITGWLRPLDERAARARAVSIAGTRPDPRLLDVGHGVAVLRLNPASIVLADSEGTHSLSAQSFSSAKADPFCRYEEQWLRHLETAHADVVGQLARHLPEELRDGRIRPLGLDRYGLRLRVESCYGDHDVRLAFSKAIDSQPQLAMELRRLVGCPFLSQA
ncbi:DUF2470 domain-containing protein [Prauserella flavalba]|uniref:DUF2470 domain-containing protein n=1 Tax=Prauserella flavalba TaxID=1477506 RepID=A0A318LZB4_9PSEU|nr:DUF2470 domain-containing protein [Prauserella flavalba]PXY38108.1 DUF2470 domain-containing protein [Prauserella flavalba]